MARITEAQVLNTLRTVQDTDRGQDIVSLGMVTGLRVQDNTVLFAIEVPPERGAAAEPVRHAAEQAVSSLPGVASVRAILTAQRASGESASATPAGRGRQAGQTSAGGAGKLSLPGITRIIAVASGKGGVGKSTVAVNLAAALKTEGLAVGIMDADIYGPSLPRLLGLSGKPESADGQKLQPKENFGIRAMSIGFLVAEDTPMIWRGPMVQSAIQQLLRDVDWGRLDVLLIDLPPGTGDAQLTLAQQVPLDGAVIVSTPQDLALLDARKGLNMFRRVDVPVLGVIENMSYFACPACGHEADIFGRGGARTEAARLGVAFLGEIPLHIDIRESADGGMPIVFAAPDGPHAQAFRAVARTVWDGLTSAQTARPAPRIRYQ